MDLGVAVNLGGGGLEDPGLYPLGQSQHVDGPHDAGLDGLDRVVLVVDGRGRTGQVVDPVHLQKDRLGDVVADQLECGVVQEMDDIPLAPGKEIVEAEHLMSIREKPFAEM